MNTRKKIKIIDLFCGIGGLSHGLIKEGFDVVAGIDNDDTCRFGYEHNNKAKFIHKDILKVSAQEIDQLFGEKEETVRVLIGCAPCQPFSTLNIKQVAENQLEPLEKFACLVKETLPDIVFMENVSGLANTEKYPIFKIFIDTLKENNYSFNKDKKYEIIDVSDYGIPQSRKRLVLLASRFGEIQLIKRTHKDKKVTVRDVIKNLEPIAAGEISKSDPLHRASKLSSKNLKRIKATQHDGGNFRSWEEDLILDCHKKESGKTYRCTVYGRMRWDAPAPTMTTQCVGLGNGRFGHPEQDRAISLREAAIFQTFPRYYKFSDPSKPVVVSHIAKFIGNAVPVELGSIIGKSIINHLEQQHVIHI